MFETSRLTFRITGAEDILALHACLNTPDMAQSISFVEHPYTLQDARAWIAVAERGIRDNKEWLFSVFLKDTQTYIGSINLHKAADGEAETGYWIAAAHQGKGYSHEMLKGIIDYGFGSLELSRIFATTSLTNEASQKVLEKNGFTRIGKIDVKTKDGPRPSWLFEIRNKT